MAFNLQVGISSKGARRGASEVRNALEGIRKGAKRTKTGLDQTTKAVQGLGNSARLIKGAIVGIFAGAGVRKIVQSADAFTKLENQIALVTGTTKEAAVVQAELFALADRSRAPIEEIGTLYGRAALSAKELGATQGELLKFTEGVAQALAINGSNAAEARGALIQLSQALGSGIVRAEEFNSVLEGARPVLISVADGMGVTVAQLRQLVIDGKITSREFFDAFQSQLGTLETQFAKTNSTIGQAGTILNNAFVEAVGTINSFSGASNGVVSIMRTLADFVRGPLVEGFIQLSINTGELINDFDNLFTAIVDVGKQFVEFTDGSINNSLDFADKVGANLMSPWDSFRTMLGIVTVETATFFDKTIGASKIWAAQITGDQALAEEGFNQAQIAEEARITSLNQLIADSQNRRESGGIATRGARGTFSAEERAAALAKTPSLGSGTATDGGGGPVDTKLTDSISKFEAANNEALKFEQRIAEINKLVADAALAGLAVDVTAVASAIQTATDSFTGFDEQLAAGQELTESLMTAQEIYNASLMEFQGLLDGGVITEETFNRAREQAQQVLDEANTSFQFMQDIGRAAAENIQGAFVDLFMSAGSGLDDFADQFGKTLQEMAANFLANQAIKFILDAAGSASGSGAIGTAISAVAKSFSENDAGGTIGSREIGIVGERGPELVRGPAAVTSRQTSAGMLGSPDIKVNVTNVSDPKAALDAVNTNSGDKQVVNSIGRNAASIKRQLGIA